MGGARPKAPLDIDDAQWVLKFGDEPHPDEPLVEHATMTLAAQAGIAVAETRPVPLSRGSAVAIKRFDRAADGIRIHALSAQVALRAASAEMSCPALAQLLRRRGPTEGNRNRNRMCELFCRLMFNILIDNTDDHEKNHVLLVNAAHQYELAPAFDVLPTGRALGHQSMRVGNRGAASSIENALSMCSAYWPSPAQALDEVRKVGRVVAGWRGHFEEAGVPGHSIERRAVQIDREELLRQRGQA